MRFRDDKYEGNYKTVVTSIIRSIQHGVEAEQLVAHAGFIRKAWKARHAQRAEAAKRGAPAERARREGPVPGSNGAYDQGQAAQQYQQYQQPAHGTGGHGGGGPAQTGASAASAMMGLKR